MAYMHVIIVYFKTKKNAVTISTTEAKLKALICTPSEAGCLMNLLIELKLTKELKIVIFEEKLISYIVFIKFIFI